MSASKLTAASTDAIAARVAAGASLTDAARAEGVHPQTAKQWITRGRKEAEGRYAVFAEAVEQARASSSARAAPVDAEEFRRRLEEAVRAGSVTAMALWARMFLHDEPAEEDGPMSMIDQLAERRRKGRAAS